MKKYTRQITKLFLILALVVTFGCEAGIEVTKMPELDPTPETFQPTGEDTQKQKVGPYKAALLPDASAILAFDFLVEEQGTKLESIRYYTLSAPLRSILPDYGGWNYELELTIGDKTHLMRVPAVVYNVTEQINEDGHFTDVALKEAKSKKLYFRVPLESPVDPGTEGSYILRLVEKEKIQIIISNPFIVPNDGRTNLKQISMQIQKGLESIKTLMAKVFQFVLPDAWAAGLFSYEDLIPYEIYSQDRKYPFGYYIPIAIKCLGYNSKEECEADALKIIDYDGVGMERENGEIAHGIFGEEPFKSNRGRFKITYAYAPVTIDPPTIDCSDKDEGKFYGSGVSCYAVCGWSTGVNPFYGWHSGTEFIINLCKAQCTAVADLSNKTAFVGTDSIRCSGGQPENVGLRPNNLRSAPHEFGHIFAYLADEYFNKPKVGDFAHYPNCAHTQEEALQWWPHWMLENLHKGCAYNENTVRYEDSSLMRWAFGSWGVINSLHLCHRIIEENGYVSSYCKQLENDYKNGLYGSDWSTVLTAECAPWTVTKVALGDHHTCALAGDRTVWCWGLNSAQQLGQPDLPVIYSTNKPLQVQDFYGVRDILAAGYYTCALKEDFSFWCWGKYPGATEISGTPTKMPIQIGFLPSVSPRHICLRSKGFHKPFCWGNNFHGQLGDGTTDDKSSPTGTVGLDAVPGLEVATGDFHTCALAEDGHVWCWGQQYVGQMEDGNFYSLGQLTPVELTAIDNVVDLSAGGRHDCAIKNDGTTWCWGENMVGQLGLGTLPEPINPDPEWAVKKIPTQVLGLEEATSVAAGSRHSCALMQNGEIWCWGWNKKGQLGNGSVNPDQGGMPTGVPTPTKVQELTFADQIALGVYHSCAVKNGEVWCWGEKTFGKTGNGSAGNQMVPAKVQCPAQ